MNTFSPILVLTGRAHGLTEPTAAGATRGHSEAHGGLRGHSIGDTYPWRVVGYGDGSWAVEGTEGIPERFYAGEDACHRAHRAARELKLLHPAGYREIGPAGCPANVSGSLHDVAGRLKGHTLVLTKANRSGATVTRRFDVTGPHPASGSKIVVYSWLQGRHIDVDLHTLAFDPRLVVELELAGD